MQRKNGSAQNTMMTSVTCPHDLFHGYLNGLTDKDSDEELNLNLIEIKSKILTRGVNVSQFY